MKELTSEFIAEIFIEARYLGRLELLEERVGSLSGWDRQSRALLAANRNKIRGDIQRTCDRVAALLTEHGVEHSVLARAIEVRRTDEVTFTPASAGEEPT